MLKRDIEKIDKCLERYLNKKTFSACSLCMSVFESGSFERIRCVRGTTDIIEGSHSVGIKTFFDIASLTKPLFTVLSLLALIKDKKISFEENIESLLGINVPEDKKKITLTELINHTSGFPAHKPYFFELNKIPEKEREAKIEEFILEEHLENEPGKNFLYSDIDYILLGIIIERKSGCKKEEYWKRKITDPLQLSENFRFFKYLVKSEKKDFVVTGKCPWSDTILCGRVNDDNCRSLGSISGHAGLFATLDGVVQLSEIILLQIKGLKDHPSIEREDLLYLVNEDRGGRWAFGFDIPTGKNPASGTFFSHHTIGHLGFTGTSFWIDIERRIIIVLLTNRVIYGEDKKKIQEMRPEIHDLLMSLVT